jgi:hypothetical protein
MPETDSSAPELPYLKKVGDRGDLDIWIVDGPWIRLHRDIEFTNFGQHYRFPFVPVNELWIDRETREDERKFFIDHLLVEHRLMAAGTPYPEAIEAANREERKERRRAGDVRRMTRNGAQLPDPQQFHERLWKQLENGIEVWIVNGRLVRSVFNIDFTAGGHDCVYEFVPDNEVWIDNDVSETERGLVLLHELHERNRMSQGLPYSKAHEESSRIEYRCRRRPDELHAALSAEGWA